MGRQLLILPNGGQGARPGFIFFGVLADEGRRGFEPEASVVLEFREKRDRMGTSPNNTPLLLLVLDACRFDYLGQGDLPWVEERLDEGFYAEKVKPSFGFCEIAELLTGVETRENGFFCQMGPAEPGETSFLLKVLAGVTAPIEGRMGEWGRELCRSVLRRVARRMDHREIYEIPAGLLGRFRATEGALDYQAPFAFGRESLFDLARAKGLEWDASAFVAFNRVAGSDRDRADRLCEIAQRAEGAPALTLGYFGDLDRVGHIYGPGSPGLRAQLKKTARLVEEVGEAFLRRGGSVLLVGDHGMLKVDEHLDLLELLGDLGRKTRIFVDSTLCRFWFEDKATQEGVEPRIREVLWPAPGFFLEEGLAREMGVPDGKDRGDLAFAANPGVVFYPDYFNRKKVLGMHGYSPEIPGQKGFCLGLGPAFAKRRVPEIRLVDVPKIAAQALGAGQVGDGVAETWVSPLYSEAAVLGEEGG